jgi:antitoxin MazE
MKTKIQKWGNSLAIRIPKAFASELGLQNDSTVEVSLTRDELVIKPSSRHYSLENLIAGITKKNRHGEEDFGTPAGGEIW